MKIQCFILLVLIALTPVFADDSEPESTVIHWHTDEWVNYTERTGNGFYHDLVRLIFRSPQFTVKISYVPWKRAVFNLKSGEADMTGVDFPRDGVLLSSVPVFEITEAIMIKPGLLESFQGLENLKDFRGVWYAGYGDDSVTATLNGSNVTSRESALEVFFQREEVDYYYDNLDQMQTQISLTASNRDPNSYEIFSFQNGQNYWLFSNSEMGLKLKNTFDKRMVELHCDGKLSALYARWSLAAEYPLFDQPC